MRKRVVEPSTVGEILSEEFMKPLNITQQQLADAMGITRKSVSLLVNGKRSLGIHEAVLLSGLFETSVEFWMNLQAAHDRWEAQKDKENYSTIRPILEVIAAGGVTAANDGRIAAAL